MITTKNIGAFIQYIYKLRHKNDAPPDLVSKWNQIPADELSLRLQQLFDSWQFSSLQRENSIADFMRYQTVVKPTVNSNSNFDSIKSPSSSSILKRVFLPLISIIFLISIIYLGFKYFQFKNLHQLYTLTERVAIRDENQQQIGTMDLNPTNATNSFQHLLAADQDIYNRAIDSTQRLFEHRKVYLNDLTFFGFITQDERMYGYVNAKFVVDSKAEFDLYRKLFGKLNASDNKRLQLKHRKVIANSLSLHPSLKSNYLISPCVSSNDKIHRLNSGILIHELIEENKYEIIAKLSDGKYYQFVGDVFSNKYAEPRAIGFEQNPNREDEFMTGDFLFRFLPKTKTYILTDCTGKKLPYTSVLNQDGIILYFQKEIPIENPIEPIIEFSEDAEDILDGAGNIIEGAKEVYHQLFD